MLLIVYYHLEWVRCLCVLAPSDLFCHILATSFQYLLLGCESFSAITGRHSERGRVARPHRWTNAVGCEEAGRLCHRRRSH